MLEKGVCRNLIFGMCGGWMLVHFGGFIFVLWGYNSENVN